MAIYKIKRIETICIEVNAKDNAEMRALYTDGTVDDHCTNVLWNPVYSDRKYLYEVDGNIVDIWNKEE
tara:strand:+ start:1738 stop:1941 length:204 start_codon:yes stop_codon:yes gene_type:complete